MREGESVLFQITRHPIGLVTVYAMFAILLVIVGISAVMAPDVLTEYNRRTVSNIGLAAFLFAAILSLVFVTIAHKIYYGNRWILTSDSLTQVNQFSLFSKQNSQLGLDNLEDVTVDQKGILSHMLDYGSLRAQTAGEHGKFIFIYCPHPNKYAKQILDARENFEHGNAYQNPQHQNN